MAQASYVEETAILRRIAQSPNCRVRYTHHALVRMGERFVNAADIECALINGHVTLQETNKKDILWRVQGRDVDGGKLEVVCAVYDDVIEIKVVTVF